MWNNRALFQMFRVQDQFRGPSDIRDVYQGPHCTACWVVLSPASPLLAPPHPSPAFCKPSRPQNWAPAATSEHASFQKLGEAAGRGQIREPGFLRASDRERGRLPLLGTQGSRRVSTALCRGGQGGRSQPQSSCLHCIQAVALRAEREMEHYIKN